MNNSGRAVTAIRTEANGSQLFLESRVLSSGRRQLTAYEIRRDARSGAETRLYADGRKITVGKDFIARSEAGHLTILSHASGLHEALLPNGKPAFRESFTAVTDASGVAHKAIVRTVYARVRGGRAFTLEHPITQTFEDISFNGADLYVYQPAVPPAGFFAPFLAPFPVAMAPGEICSECTASDEVEFSEPPHPYTDPSQMLADNVIAGGIHDGKAGAQDTVSAPDGVEDPNVPPVALGNATPDPELANLTSEAAKLSAQVDAARAQDAVLKEQLGGSGQLDAAGPAQTRQNPVLVESEVREEVRKEVKQDISLHQRQEPLALTTVLNSKKPQNYLFQVNDVLSTTDASSDEGCALSTGDLLRFDELPADNASAAHMKVVTSKEGSCNAGTVVLVGFSDLQNMLNGFSQRLETAMQETRGKIATPSQPAEGSKG